MLQYSLTVRVEVTWYNKCFRYDSRPQMQERTEHEFMEHVLREVYKRPHQRTLAKQLQQRLEQGTLNMEDLLLQLREDRQLEERLHAAVTLSGSKDSGDAESLQTIRRVINASLRPIKRRRIKCAQFVERIMTSPSSRRKKLD
jgi:hypothetical protein